MIIFCAKEQNKKIKNKIEEIKFAIINWKLVIDARKRRSIQKRKQKLNERDKDIIQQQIKNISRAPKAIRLKERRKNNYDNPPIKNKNQIHKKSKNKSTNKINNNKEIILSNNINSKRKIQSSNNNEEVIEKAKKIMILNDNEVNDFSYKEAKKYDRRTYCMYYISLLRTNHDISFTFFYNEDYNSKIIKIDLFAFSLTLSFAMNAIFFNDETMHKIYEDEGSFNLIYNLPQIIYSSIISGVLLYFLKLLALSEDLILKFKSNKSTEQLNTREKSLKKCIKTKLIFYFILSTFFLLFFRYYISMFSAIYVNT